MHRKEEMNKIIDLYGVWNVDNVYEKDRILDISFTFIRLCKY